MTDVVDRQTRSRMMAGIRGRNTKPELAVRSHLHRAGLRFRLHAPLPGTPDLTLPKWLAVVFVNGCFWHRHRGCKYAYQPRSNRVFWKRKFSATVERDSRKAQLLRAIGWRVFVLWECELTAARMNQLIARITRARKTRSH